MYVHSSFAPFPQQQKSYWKRFLACLTITRRKEIYSSLFWCPKNLLF